MCAHGEAKTHFQFKMYQGPFRSGFHVIHRAAPRSDEERSIPLLINHRLDEILLMSVKSGNVTAGVDGLVHAFLMYCEI